jgi:hypothetical protein
MRHLTLALLLLAGGCTVRRVEPPGGTEEDRLRALVQQYYRDLSARQWPAYADYFWPRATLTTVWQPPGDSTPHVVSTPIETFLASTAAGPDSKPVFEERLLSQEVHVTGDLAQVWARYETRFGDSAAVRSWRGMDAFTWMRHEGRWRITSLGYADEPGQTRGAP